MSTTLKLDVTSFNPSLFGEDEDDPPAGAASEASNHSEAESDVKPPSNTLQSSALAHSSHSLSIATGQKTVKDDSRLWDKTFSDDFNESSNDVPKTKFCRTLTSSSNSESEPEEKNSEDSDNQEDDYNPNSDDSSYKKEDESGDDQSKNASDDEDDIDNDDDDIPLQVRVQQQSGLKKERHSSRKKSRLEMSDEYSKDPDLYGVRRSGRIKVNKIRQEEIADQRKHALSRMNRHNGRNRKIQPRSNWDSSDEEESEENYTDSSEEERLARKRRKNKLSQKNRKSASRPHRSIGGRACTAGKSYKEASTSEGFSDDEPGIDDITENSDDDDESSQSASVSNSTFKNKRKNSRDTSVASAYYKPSNKVHPLLQSGARHNFAQSSYNRASSGGTTSFSRVRRLSHVGSQRSGDEENRRSDGEIDDDSVSNYQSHSNYVAYTSEVEVIERVVDYRLGRKNAVGDATTIYLLKQGTDPNEGFNAELEKEDAVPQYLIKWKDWSHLHNTWESMESLARRPADGLKKIERFNQELKRLSKWKNEDATVEEIEEYNYQEEQNMHLYEQYRTVERVIIHRDECADGTEYLVKWMGLNYAEASWEAGWVIEKLFPQQVDDYRIRNKCTNLPVPRNSQSAISMRMQKHRHTKPFKEQPKYIGSSDFKLRDYQLDGINFLLASFIRGRSVILADEMGLGKTIQTIGFLSVLYKELNIYGPFLLVVPLSTLPSWQKEFAQWAPFINVVSYIGDRISREKIRQFEWYVPNNRKSLRFNACLTTYEMILKDWKFLKDIHWSVLAVDEAHRLKNNESLLYQLLQGFNTYYRLLITGTPLQNSLHELWALLHFLMPYEFDDWDEFSSKYSIEKPSDCMNLWKLLAPYIFRRVKKQVEASLPAKVEKILRVELSRKQKQYYKWILTKNYAALSRGVKGSITGFVNIVMELKKLCNHPYLVRGEDENVMMKPEEKLKAITRDSGKMLLLDKLLLRLKSRGHRVLIFSQMVRMLDILEDYLRLRGWFFQRLDGSVRGDLRKNALDHFNAENSVDFVFLLSTRAGGLGINLASADTVIIFDSDWNPQNDLQAQARAHRIGQTKQVSVYRFVQTGSVEETIIERAKKKMVLDHLVIQRMDTTGRTVLNKKSGVQQPFNKEDLNEILKFGAEEMFKEPEGEEAECPELNIDDVLNEAETRDVEEENNKSGADELLSFFQVHNFTYDDLEEEQVHEAKARLKESENKEKRSKESDPEAKSWDNIIPEDEIQKAKEIENQELLVQLNLGPRNRKQTKLFNYGQDDNEDEDDDDDDEDDNNDEGKGKMLKDKDLRSLVRSMRRFPRPQERIEAIIAESDRLQELSVNRIRSVLTDILQKCNDAMTKWIEEEEQRKLDEKGSPDPKDDESSKMSSGEKKAKKAGPTFEIGQSVTVNAKLITQAISDLEPLAKAMPADHKDRLKYSLPVCPKPVSQWKTDWSIRDDAQLLVGVFEHGMDNWDSIKMDPELDLIDKILPPNGKHRPQANHLKTRVEYLIKLLGQFQRDPSSISGPQRGHSSTHRPEKKGAPSASRKRPSGNSSAPPRKKAPIVLPSGKSREFIEDSNVSSLSSSSSDSEIESQKRPSNALDSNSLHSKIKQDEDRDKKANKKKRKLEDGESGDANQNSKKIKKEPAPVKKKKTFNDPMHFTTHEPVLVKEEIKAEAEKQRSRGGDEETLSSERFKELKDVMRPVRKILKRLETCDLKDETRTVDYVLRLGNHIRDIYHQQKSQSEVRRWRNDLWQFVSLFVDLSKEDLHNMYKRTFRAKKEKDKGSDEPPKRRYSSDERKESHHDRKSHNHRSHHHHHQHRDKNSSKSDSYHQSHHQDHPSLPRIGAQDSSHNSSRPHQHYKSSYSHYSSVESDSNSMHHNYVNRDSSDFHRSGIQRHQRPTDSYNRHPQHHWGMSGSNNYGPDGGGGGGGYGWRHGGGSAGGGHRPPPPTDAYNAYNRRPGHTGPHNSRWS